VKAAGGLGPPTIHGDSVYAGSADGNLYAVAISTGKVRWTYAAKEDLSTRPAVVGAVVVVASLQDTVFGVDAATGAWRWHHRREQKGEGLTIYGAASVAVGGGVVFAGYSDGFVAALDPATGTAHWERRVAPNGTYLDVDSVAADGDRLYAAAFSGAVLALDARTGKAVWSFAAPGACRVLVGAGSIFAVTSTSVLALSPVNGAQLWTTPLDGAPGAAPALAGKWLVVPAGPGGLRWLEAATGRPLRRFDPGTGVLAGPGVGGGRVYVLSNAGDLFALDVG
jgi:outer membrane protein assembly factor BamB